MLCVLKRQRLSGLAQYLRTVNSSAVCLALSAIALGRALQISSGFYRPRALIWLTGALVLCIAGTIAERTSAGLSRQTRTFVGAIVACGIVWQVQQLLTAQPGLYLSRSGLPLFRAAVVVQTAIVAVGLARIPFVKRVWFPALLAVSVGIGVWMIKASPHPYIDVVQVYREAIDALVHHRDPYQISFENIYDAQDAARFYNPAALIGNRIAIAYPYPPASLFAVVPGQVLLGDYRYAELLLLVAGAALIGYCRRSMMARLAAALLLTTPRIWFVIEQGWAEPVAVFLLALTTFLLIRHQVLAGLAGGLFVVTKQYLGFTGLAVLRFVFMRPRQWTWTAFGLVVTACAATLPLALWHPHAFMQNVVWLQTLEPFRSDSLSYLSWAARNGIGRGSFVWAVVAASAASVFSVLATRNTPAGFATSVALTTFMMFAFGSKAFCNYYFFVLGALCCAIAALPRSGEPDFTSGWRSFEERAQTADRGRR